MAIFSVNYISTFYMGLCISGRSHIKYTYMIDREYNHMVLPDYTNLFP